MLWCYMWYCCLLCRKSASCTHVSALLHAVASLTAPHFQLQPTDFPGASSSDEQAVPITSRLCQWKAPRKKKESSMMMAEAPFVKLCGRERKRKLTPLEDFDPRPAHFRGTARDNLPDLLNEDLAE